LTVRLQLERRWAEWLLRLPESGMGYQRVDVQFDDGRTLEDIPVFNAEELEVPPGFEQARPRHISLHREP
jgi:hypothetical protein